MTDLPPSIDEILIEERCDSSSTMSRIAQRIAAEACKLQREADGEVALYFGLNGRARINAAPLVVPAPKEKE